MRNEHEILINSPVESVFSFVSNMDNFPQWHPVEADRLTQGPVDVGTIWRITGQIQGQPVVAEIEVTRYELDLERISRNSDEEKKNGSVFHLIQIS